MDDWGACLELHPDPAYAHYIVSGISKISLLKRVTEASADTLGGGVVRV